MPREELIWKSTRADPLETHQALEYRFATIGTCSWVSKKATAHFIYASSDQSGNVNLILETVGKWSDDTTDSSGLPHDQARS